MKNQTQLLLKAFSAEIKAHRERLRLTQAEAALACEMPLRTWEDYEAGRREPPKWVQELIYGKLANATGTKVPRGKTWDACRTKAEVEEYVRQETKPVDAALAVVPKVKLKKVRQKPQEGVEMVVRAVRAVGEAGRAVGAAMEAVRPIMERMRRKP